MTAQTSFFATVSESVALPQNERSGSFVDNMSLPVHRWFRYSAGFSAEWVENELRDSDRSQNVFDPFAGSGTTLLAAEAANHNAIGQEAHPFVHRIAQAKLDWSTDITEFLSLGRKILREAQMLLRDAAPQRLLSKCYSAESLAEIQAIRLALENSSSDTPCWRLCWLAFAAILRNTSHVGTAQWQYLLPNKSKAKVVAPFRAYEEQLLKMASDMSIRTSVDIKPRASILNEDCRAQGSVPDEWADFVITSPPYVNNYDYADATRLEMTVLGEIDGWGDLQKSVREKLVRSCTQHVAPYAKLAKDLLSKEEIAPIQRELHQVFEKLFVEKSLHGGKKPYDAMVVHYFYDMAFVWKQLRRICRSGARICFVLGDSAPYGIYVPVEKFHAQLALNAGFSDPTFVKLRDRNLKWKNRKHQVPLKEGQLWLNG